MAIETFKEVVQRSGLPIIGSNSAKVKLITRGATKQSGGCLPDDITVEGAKQRFKIIGGEMMSGNTNRELRNEASDLITYLRGQGALTKNEATKLYQDFVAK